MDPNTSDAEKQAFIRQIVQQHYPDAHRISVTVSATGQGQHLRWHYSEDLIEQEEERKPLRGVSPAASQVTFTQVDNDGDSQMGDEEDRFRTPQPVGPYDPGSVVLTPHKRQTVTQPIKREQRIGGGLDWWHEQDGVDMRLTFVADGAHVEINHGQLGPDTQHVYNLVQAQRERHGTPAHRDDDVRSVSSLRSEATIIIDPRDPTKPTLFNGEMPIVRQPTVTSEQNLSGTTANSAASSSGSGRAQAGRGLSTIQEEGSRTEDNGRPDTRAWPPRLPDFGYVRLFHDQGGNWVRDGSLPPDATYYIDRSMLPPKIDEAGRAAELRAARAARGVQIQRTDTEVVVRPRRKLIPVVEIPVRRMPRAVRKAEPKVEPARSPLRRSERIKNRQK